MTAELRASDADRNRVATELQHHAGTGRISLDELSERVAAAYHARTLGDLDQLTNDLPRQHTETSSRRPGMPPVPGTAVFGAAIAAILLLLVAGLTPMCG